MNQQLTAATTAGAGVGQYAIAPGSLDPVQYAAVLTGQSAVVMQPAATGTSSTTAQGYYDVAGNFHYYDYSQYYTQSNAPADTDSTQSKCTDA